MCLCSGPVVVDSDIMFAGGGSPVMRSAVLEKSNFRKRCRSCFPLHTRVRERSSSDATSTQTPTHARRTRFHEPDINRHMPARCFWTDKHPPARGRGVNMTPKTQGFQLSPQQKRLWLLQQDSRAYRAQCAVLIEGD